jgi:hypothetical protein
MPKDASVICYVRPEDLSNGLAQSQWAAIVSKTLTILQQRNATAGGNNFSERRKEQRLRTSGLVQFGKVSGSMLDVSSGGMSFVCRNSSQTPQDGENITARFAVPWFGSDGQVQMRKFTRNCRICRSSTNNHTKRLAVQFTEPLPFRPACQDDLSEVNRTHQPSA